MSTTTSSLPTAKHYANSSQGTQYDHQQAPSTWHMSDCNPTKKPCSGKLDELLTPLQQVPATTDPALLRDYKELIGSLLFLQTFVTL
jgi:hypothetical protein